MLQKYDFSITQQVTESFVIQIRDTNQNPRDLTGHEFLLQCRSTPTSSTTLFTLSSTASPQTITLGQTDSTTTVFDEIILVLTHDLTKDVEFDKGVYDLLMYLPDKSHVEMLMSGTVTLKRSVTKLA